MFNQYTLISKTLDIKGNLSWAQKIKAIVFSDSLHGRFLEGTERIYIMLLVEFILPIKIQLRHFMQRERRILWKKTYTGSPSMNIISTIK